jgi:hypothetical protein
MKRKCEFMWRRAGKTCLQVVGKAFRPFTSIGTGDPPGKVQGVLENLWTMGTELWRHFGESPILK